MRIAIILGTRPEIIKLSPIIRECEKRNLDFFILHTNQHYSEGMDKIFFDELELPRPKYNLNIGSGMHGEQTGKMLIETEKVLLKEKPHLVLLQGDTNTVLAGALVASKINIKIGHIESGLRSYDRTMPEEINRVITDHISDYLFAPTEKSSQNLIKEGISEDKILITGNTIVDAIKQNLVIAKKMNYLFNLLNLKKGEYFLLTIHRPSNVDNIKNLRNIFDGLKIVYERFKLPILFPIHPRTKKNMEIFRIDPFEGMIIIEPQGYLEFLQLENNAKLIFTDSGGIQEEACVLRVPCVTLRENTERPETLDVGANILSGSNPTEILESTIKMLAKKNNFKNPFGDGTASKKIINYLLRNF